MCIYVYTYALHPFIHLGWASQLEREVLLSESKKDIRDKDNVISNSPWGKTSDAGSWNEKIMFLLKSTNSW